MQIEINIAQTFNDPQASYREVNGTEELKRLQLRQLEGPCNFAGCSNLIGQEPCDVSV